MKANRVDVDDMQVGSVYGKVRLIQFIARGLHQKWSLHLKVRAVRRRREHHITGSCEAVLGIHVLQTVLQYCLSIELNAVLKQQHWSRARLVWNCDRSHQTNHLIASDAHEFTYRRIGRSVGHSIGRSDILSNSGSGSHSRRLFNGQTQTLLWFDNFLLISVFRHFDAENAQIVSDKLIQ